MIVGISGERGVGKTTAARYMEKFYGFTVVSLAEPIRELASSLFPFNHLDFSDVKRKESPFRNYEWTPREFMINLGEFLRYHDKDYWVKKAVARLKGDGLYVIDDLRFTNEAEVLKKMKAQLIRIERYENKNPYGKRLQIPSERDLDEYPFNFTINGIQNLTLTSLTDNIDIIMDELGVKPCKRR